MRAVLIATGSLIVINAAAISAHRLPEQGAALRGLHYLYDAGQHLALGLCLALAAAAGVRLKLSSRMAALSATIVGAAIAGATLPSDLDNFAWRVLPGAPGVVFVAGCGSVALIVGALVLWCPRVSSRRARVPMIAAGLSLLAGNHVILQNDYPAVHLALALLGFTLVASTCTSAPLPRQWPAVARASPWVLAALIALFAVSVRPSTPLIVEMLRHEGSVVMPVLSRVQARAVGGNVVVPAESAQWFRSRATAKDIPPSTGSVLPRDAILLLVSVDSLRADVFFGRKNDERFPFMARLRDEGVAFQHARTPGSQTVYTVTSLFSCVYFSQLYWSQRPGLWPHADETERFPAILARNGIRTLQVSAAPWLVNDWGVARGFAEEEHVRPPKGSKYTPAPLVVDALLARMGTPERSMFAFVHFLDVHLGMRRRAPGKDDLARYLHQLNVVDGQLARMEQALRDRELLDRVTWILTADHGESFGEHGATGHASTLYEHALRVPIVIRSPTTRPRQVDTPVSVIDLGPTILDLYRLPTPGRCMGQSLTGFLREGPPPKIDPSHRGRRAAQARHGSRQPPEGDRRQSR